MKNTVFSTIIVILLLIVITMQFFSLASGGNGSNIAPEKIRQLAAKLESEELFPQAVEQYKRFLDNPAIPDDIRANILFRIGTIYLDQMQNYENALAAFIQIGDLYPRSSVAVDAEKRKLPCYEGLKRGFDAQKKLKKLTDLNPEEEPGTGPVVAMIGDKKITLDQIDREIAAMPEPYQKQFSTAEAKLEFLKSKLFEDLLYDKALRKEYNKDKEVRKQVRDFEKNILSGKVYTEEVRNSITVSPNDIDLYYKAHQSEFVIPAKEKIAQIQVDNVTKASEIRKEIQNGLAFDEAVKKYTLDEKSKNTAGVIGEINGKQNFIPGLGQSPEIVSQLMKLDKDALSEPIENADVCYLFKVLEKTPEKQQTQEEAKQRVEMQVRQMKEKEKRDALTEELLKSEKVKIYEQTIMANSGAPGQKQDGASGQKPEGASGQKLNKNETVPKAK